MNMKTLSTATAVAALGIGLPSCAHDTTPAARTQARARTCNNRPQAPPVSPNAKGRWAAIAAEFNRTIAFGASGIYVSSLEPVGETVELQVTYIPNLTCIKLFTETCAVPLNAARQATIDGGYIVFAAADGSVSIQHRRWVDAPADGGSRETVEQVVRCVLPFESATKLVDLLSHGVVEQTIRD